MKTYHAIASTSEIMKRLLIQQIGGSLESTNCLQSLITFYDNK